MRLRVSGGSFGAGKQTITVRKGHRVNLVNTATGESLAIRFSAPTTKTSSTDMNPLQRKAKTVEMTKSTDHRDVSGGLGRRLRRPAPSVRGARRRSRRGPRATGSAAGSALPKPTGLKTFSAARTSLDGSQRRRARFSRTPAFAWAPVRGATRYEFELSTSKRFRADNGLVWSSKTPDDARRRRSDLASVDHRRRRCTGMFARVAAARSRRGAPQAVQHALAVGVPMQLPTSPASSAGSRSPGYVHWHDVWFGASALHQSVVRRSPRQDRLDDHERRRPARVLRASRAGTSVRVARPRPPRLYGSTTNGLPAVSYGPWSAEYDSERAGDARRPALVQPGGDAVSDASFAQARPACTT